MPTLAEVIAGIVQDVVMARRESDLVSRDLAVAYRADSLLRFFDVPHVRLSDITVTLRFAFAPSAGVVPPPLRPPPRWLPVVTDTIIPEAFHRLTRDGFARVQEQVRSFVKAYAVAVTEDQLLSAARNSAATLAAVTARSVASVFERMRSTHAELGDSSQLERETAAVAEKHAQEFLAALASANAPLSARPQEGPIQVIIDAAGLVAMPDHAIQEIRFVIQASDISADSRDGMQAQGGA